MTYDNDSQIVKCLEAYQELLEKRKEWGPIEAWRYSQFRDLATDLTEKTGVSVSYMTLMRIFQRKDFKRSPQLATLDAFAKYLDFKDWESFCQLNNTFSNVPSTIQGQKKKTFRNLSLLTLILISLGVLSVGIWGSILISKTSNRIFKEQIQLENLSENPHVPEMLVFKYKVPSEGYTFYIKPASIEMQIDHKKNKFKKKNPPRELDPKDSLLTINVDGSLYPGPYEAMIVKGDSIMKSFIVNFETKDWINMINIKPRLRANGKFRPLFANSEISENGVLHVPERISQDIQNNYLETIYEVNYFLARDFEIDANEFEFETRVKSMSPKQVVNCKYLRVSLLTTNKMIEIPLVQKGCKSLLRMWVSDQIFSYLNKDMDQYESEQLDWEKIKIKTSNKVASIYRNDELIDQIPYNENLGELGCIRFKFEGNGVIDYVKLKDEAGNEKYAEEFNSNVILDDNVLTE
ncbi:MAG: hypothetical protein AAFO07_24015 [Bacteroidota bacterium]